MSKILLVEHYSASEANLIEYTDEKKNYFLSGRIMAGNVKNGNQRVYPSREIERAVSFIKEKATEGNCVLGELNHPDGLSIDLKNVSHMIIEAKMDGEHAYGKCKLLNTPSGQIARGLLEGGARLGVSSRGTGNVNNEGIVEDFNFITLDIVSNPSGPGCYPDLVRESIENQKILSLAEAVCHDTDAQKYFKKEMKAFINALTRKK